MRTSAWISSAGLIGIATFLGGCIDPSAQIDGGTQFPAQPPPDKPYQCGVSTGAPCAEPRARAWVPGWSLTNLAARGNKVAFTAYPTLPTGGANSAEPQYLGQLDWNKGTLDWMVKLGTQQYDVYWVYDLTIAPSGDIILGATGYGESLLGSKVSQFDGFIASFDSLGKKRFAQRLEIWDVKPQPGYEPRLNSLEIIAGDDIFVQTAFQDTPPNQATQFPVHLFAFKSTGEQMFRKEVPTTPSTYGGTMWAVPDGSMWIETIVGQFRRYSKTGDVLDTFELQPDAQMRGFIAMNAKTMLINLTTKGMTNELYRFDIGAPLVPLFGESTFPEFHAAGMAHSVDYGRAYFVSLAYNGLSERIQSIDTNGNRGPATTVRNVFSRIGLLESGEGVFARYTEFGTEFIVQPL
jgi:hypothetical protein